MYNEKYLHKQKTCYVGNVNYARNNLLDLLGLRLQEVLFFFSVHCGLR